jgi:hypothetical protein
MSVGQQKSKRTGSKVLNLAKRNRMRMCHRQLIQIKRVIKENKKVRIQKKPILLLISVISLLILHLLLL